MALKSENPKENVITVNIKTEGFIRNPKSEVLTHEILKYNQVS